MISHYLGVFWLNRAAVADLIKATPLPVDSYATPNIIEKINSLPLINWGAYGVALFFLVSGFVIPFSISKTTAIGFLANRILRIFPLYWCGFTITLVALWIAELYFDTGWQFGAGVIVAHYFPGLRELIWSPNIDGVIWTLDIEMMFYVLCVVSIAAFRRNSPTLFLVPVVLFFLSYWIALQLSSIQALSEFWYIRALSIIHPAPFLIFMYIGTSLHFFFTGKMPLHRTIPLIICILIMFYLLLKSGPFPGIVAAVPSYLAALMTFIFAMCFPRLFQSNPITNFLSDISYPLYAVHGVAGYVVLRILLDQGLPAWLSTLLTMCGVILISWLLHKWVEVYFHTKGKKLEAMASAWRPIRATNHPSHELR